MTIIKSEQLKKNLIPLEVSIIKLSNQIYLKIDELDDFLKFASRLGSEYLYFHYTYYNSEEYTIPVDWYSEYSIDFKNVVSQHNQHIEALDFKSPRSLTLFIIQTVL